MLAAQLVPTAIRQHFSDVYASDEMRELFDAADPIGETEHHFCSRLASDLLSTIPPDRPILDLGCGSRRRPPIPVEDARLVRLDWAVSALRGATNGVAADWSEIPLADNTVAAVISECGLSLESATERSLIEISRILTNPGSFLISAVARSTDMADHVRRFCELAARWGLAPIASEDTTETWVDSMTRRHELRRQAAIRLRSRMPAVAEATISVSDAMLEPKTGVIATHRRNELLLTLRSQPAKS